MLQTSILHAMELLSPKSEAPPVGGSCRRHLILSSSLEHPHSIIISLCDCISSCEMNSWIDQAHMCKASMHCKALVHPLYKINWYKRVPSLSVRMVVTLGCGCLGKSTMVLTWCGFLAWELSTWVTILFALACVLLQQSTVNKMFAKHQGNKSCCPPTNSLGTMGSSCLRPKSYPLHLSGLLWKEGRSRREGAL